AQGTSGRRFVRGRGARGSARIGGGRNAVDGSAPGDQGACLLPRRTEHRAPGSRRDFDGVDPASARACGHRRAMTERGLRGVVVSAGVAVGPAFVTPEPVAAPDGGGPDAALVALARVAAELARTEARLAAQGLGAEA